MPDFVKNLIPGKVLKFLRPIYHGAVAVFADYYFGHPSRNLLVAGITGTVGKSTTAAMLAYILNESGKKCGLMTTVDFFDGDKHHINKHGLSMPGGWLLQKQLRRMLNNGCSCAVVECTSEGLAQNRHFGISFDIAAFTNISRAHLEAHGSFENYKVAKGRLFGELGKRVYEPAKVRSIPKTIVANLDDPSSGYFLSFKVDKKIGVTRDETKKDYQLDEVLLLQGIKTGEVLEFFLEQTAFYLKMTGAFNAENAALAAACATVFGVRLNSAAAALKTFSGVPGRMEPVENNLGAQIFVDYACEPASFESAAKAAAVLPHRKIIHVFGSTGGHRDAEKRFLFGKISAQYADEIIITNDDVYDSDPEKIAKDIQNGVKQGAGSKLIAPSCEIILDRRQGIHRALQKALPGDLVLITGKGSEQFLVLPGNKRINWDDSRVVRECLKELL